MPELTILGAGTCLFEPGYSPSSHHLRTDSGKSILIDAGPGVMRRLTDNGINPHELDAVVLTHDHADHFGGLLELFQGLYVGTKYHPNLSYVRAQEKPLPIIGFAGVEEVVRTFDQYALGEQQYFLPLPITMHDGDTWDGADIHLQAFHVPHTDVSLGYRIEVDGKVLGYTGDTNADPILETILKDVDLGLCNAAMPDGDRLTPAKAAQHATQANAKKLVLAHFYPEVVARLSEMDSWVRASYQGPYEVAKDGMKISF